MLRVARSASSGTEGAEGSAATLLPDGWLRVAQKTNTGSLAMKLADILSKEGQAFAVSRGANATYVALKAAITANQKFSDKGQQVVVASNKNIVRQGSEEMFNTVHHYRLVQVPASSGPVTKATDLRVVRESNVGALAGAIKQRIQEDGVAVMNAMGAHCVSQAMKAVAQAQKYCDLENFQGTLAVLPSMQENRTQDLVITYVQLRVRAI